MSARMERIEKAPGFWRRGSRVYFSYRDDRGKQRWASGRNLSEARRLREELATDVRRGEYVRRAPLTFEEYARRWIDTYPGRTSRGLRESTRDDYRKRLEADAIPFFGAMRLSDVRPLDVKEYAAKIAERGVSANTVRLGIAPVRALFATALEEGLVRSNSAAGLRLLVRRELDEELPADDVKALTEDELAAVLAKLPAPWRTFFHFLAATGLRIGEAIELRWRDVDLGERTIRVERGFYRGRVDRPKSSYGRRRVRLTPKLARELWTLRRSRGEDELLFVTPRGGRISPPSVMRDVLKPAAVAADVGDWVGFHTFRHTCATILFRRGWNAVQVQRWLGHHRPSFTLDTYVHLLDADLPEPPSIAEGVNESVNNEPQEDARSEGLDEPQIRAVRRGKASQRDAVREARR